MQIVIQMSSIRYSQIYNCQILVFRPGYVLKYAQVESEYFLNVPYHFPFFLAKA